MAVEPYDFFGNVAAIRIQANLSGKITLIKCDIVRF